jgi:hypothetical protein
MDPRPLWTCAKCGRRFANRNQSHACGRYGIDHHFRGKAPEIRALFDAFAALIASIGPATVLPEKSRIAFQLRMSFAQVTPKQGWHDGHFVLARRAESPLFRKIDTISPRNHVHHFRLRSPADLTPEFRQFAREACAVGRQEHLRKP